MDNIEIVWSIANQMNNHLVTVIKSCKDKLARKLVNRIINDYIIILMTYIHLLNDPECGSGYSAYSHVKGCANRISKNLKDLCQMITVAQATKLYDDPMFAAMWLICENFIHGNVPNSVKETGLMKMLVEANYANVFDATNGKIDKDKLLSSLECLKYIVGSSQVDFEATKTNVKVIWHLEPPEDEFKEDDDDGYDTFMNHDNEYGECEPDANE